MKLILEPGDHPTLEALQEQADDYGWWVKIVCRPGREPFGTLAYRGGGITLESGQVEVVFAEPEPEKKTPRRPKAAA